MRRGVAAGLVAGLLAGLFALVVGEPPLDAAIALEQPGAGGISRGVQKLGLVLGSVLLGSGLGALFGLVAAWGQGRVQGDDWVRSLKLGAVITAALVVLPALAYPPNPPGVGDPATVGLRTRLYLGACVLGLLLALGAWSTSRILQRRHGHGPWRQALVGVGVVAAAVLILAALPPLQHPVPVPGELLWRFRLAAVGTQLVLYLGIAVTFGLLSQQSTRRTWASP